MTKVVDLTYKYHLKCEKKMNPRGKWLKDMFKRFPEAKKISNKCIFFLMQFQSHSRNAN